MSVEIVAAQIGRGVTYRACDVITVRNLPLVALADVDAVAGEHPYLHDLQDRTEPAHSHVSSHAQRHKARIYWRYVLFLDWQVFTWALEADRPLDVRPPLLPPRFLLRVVSFVGRICLDTHKTHTRHTQDTRQDTHKTHTRHTMSISNSILARKHSNGGGRKD